MTTADPGAPGPQAPAKPHRYSIKYLIVDDFGDLLWSGTIQIAQDKPRPTDAFEIAVMDVQTARTVRQSCNGIGAPAGRVLIAAVREIG